MTDRAVEIGSPSRAADLGHLALRDLTRAASVLDPASESGNYRIIGGHMVQLLAHAFPAPAFQPRATADADAGIARPVAAGAELHRRLVALGYEPVAGNSYRRDTPEGGRCIDLLVPFGTGRAVEEIGGRGFDSAPGLGLALAMPPVVVVATVRLCGADAGIRYTAPVPAPEAAVVMKALAWGRRYADRDVADLATLFEVVEHHRDVLPSWGLDRAPLRASRADAATTLRLLVERLERGGAARGTLPIPAPRLAALIRRHVQLPS